MSERDEAAVRCPECEHLAALHTAHEDGPDAGCAVCERQRFVNHGWGPQCRLSSVRIADLTTAAPTEATT